MHVVHLVLCLLLLPLEHPHQSTPHYPEYLPVAAPNQYKVIFFFLRLTLLFLLLNFSLFLL
jgi:hypothetical protein